MTSRRTQFLVDVLAVGAGLAAYAYAAGGVIEYLRLAGAGLPATQAITLVSNRQFLVLGVEVILTAIALWALVSSMMWLWRIAQKRWHRHDKTELSSRARSGLGAATDGAAFGAALGATFGVSLGLFGLLYGDKASSFEQFGSYVARASVAGLVVGFFTGLVAALRTTALSWRDLLALPPRWIALLFLGLALVAASSLVYLTPLRLPLVVVRTSLGGCVSGLYIGRDASGVHLVDSKSKDLLTIEANDISAVDLGPSVDASRVPITHGSCPDVLGSAV